MKLNKKRKIGVILMILTVVAFLTSATTVNAEINSGYGTNFGVDKTGLDETISNTTLLDLLGHLVFAVGRILEWTLGAIFKAITGSSDFPWADKIVFNAVAMLDVNFINPNAKSFVGQGGIKAAIGNVYSTVFSLAFSFFGIFALLSAIKLAISTIADQKAKYKQALVDWCMGFVMLFCMHYFMSFIFYLNEQLVVTASDIATTAISQAGVKLKVQAAATGQQLIDNAKAAGYGTKLSKYPGVATVWAGLPASDTSNGMQEAFMKYYSPATLVESIVDQALSEKEIYANLESLITWLETDCPSYDTIEKAKAKVFVGENGAANRSAIVKEVYDELKIESLKNELNKNLVGTGRAVLLVTTNNKDDTEVNEMYDDKEGIGEDIWKINNGTKGTWTNDATTLQGYGIKKISAGQSIDFMFSASNYSWDLFLRDLLKVKAAYDAEVAAPGGAVAGSTTAGAVITELATYFRATSYEAEFRSTNVSGTKEKGNVNTVNAIMYAILVAQSLILFISYIKRLFYVIVLGLMSPAVVAYDFFKRFGK